MIEFKDFARKPKLGGLTSHPFESAVEAANEWIAQQDGLRILNVETISDTSSFLGSDIVSTKATGVRCWFVRANA